MASLNHGFLSGKVWIKSTYSMGFLRGLNGIKYESPQYSGWYIVKVVIKS